MRHTVWRATAIALLAGSIAARSAGDGGWVFSSGRRRSPCELDRSGVESADWRAAIATARSHMSRFGGYYSLMRVVLKGAKRGEKVRVDATKLKALTGKYDGGGRQFREVRSGEFVFIEHVKTSRRRKGKDPVVLQSPTRGKTDDLDSRAHARCARGRGRRDIPTRIG